MHWPTDGHERPVRSSLLLSIAWAPLGSPETAKPLAGSNVTSSPALSTAVHWPVEGHDRSVSSSLPSMLVTVGLPAVTVIGLNVTSLPVASTTVHWPVDGHERLLAVLSMRTGATVPPARRQSGGRVERHLTAAADGRALVGRRTRHANQARIQVQPCVADRAVGANGAGIECLLVAAPVDRRALVRRRHETLSNSREPSTSCGPLTSPAMADRVTGSKLIS